MLERFKKSSTTDPGLGEIYNRKTKRVINQDGTFNVVRKGMKSHLYQDLIDMNKWKFNFIVFSFEWHICRYLYLYRY